MILGNQKINQKECMIDQKKAIRSLREHSGSSIQDPVAIVEITTAVERQQKHLEINLI